MGKRLILAVDDNRSNLSIIKTILVRSDYVIITATCGAEAVKTAEVAQPDLILLDIKMPEMDGFETCTQLKHLKSTKHIPVIFLTADTEIKSMVKGFEIGAVDYITKPFNSVELRTRIKTHLDLVLKEEMIREKSNEQKELLHILCHDLTNPLGNLETILEMYAEDHAVLIDFLEPMKASIRNGLELIELVRRIRSFDEEKYALQLATENLYDITTEAISIIQQNAKRKQVEFDLKIDKEHFAVMEKTSFINTILNNLFTNAIKFSFPNSKIEVNSDKQGSTVQLSIRDFGIGMPPQLIDDIFDISKYTSRPGTENEEGTGYGMPLIKKFMLAYGGGINVISREKTMESKFHGTEIILSLKSGLE